MTLPEYIESHSTSADAVLDAVERWAHLHTAQPQMVCGPAEGALLTMLCRLSNAKTAVEIGSFIGYSTICIARGLADGGILHAFEINEEYESPIRRHLDMAGVGERVSLHIGDAKELIIDYFKESTEGCGPTSPTSLVHSQSIDFAFVDAEKRSCREFYDILVPLVRPGGIIVVDNVLWGNKVLDEDQYKDLDTRLFREFNDYVTSDPRTSNILLPIRDGIMLVMKNFD